MVDSEIYGKSEVADVESYLNPLVSVVVVSYNAEQYVVECLESISAQTYSRIELIVCDDGSRDKTQSIIKNWIKQNKQFFESLKFIFHEINNGTTFNLNSGLKSASGDWIKIIAADDALFEDCIENYIEETKKAPAIRALYSDVQKYKDELEESFSMYTPSLKDAAISDGNLDAIQQFKILLLSNPVWAPSLFFQKSLMEEIGYCDESVRLFEDRPLLLKITRSGEKLHFCGFISAKYRIHSASIQRIKNDNVLFSSLQIEQARYLLENYFINIFGLLGFLLRARCRFVIFMSQNYNHRNFWTRIIRFVFMKSIGSVEKFLPRTSATIQYKF